MAQFECRTASVHLNDIHVHAHTIHTPRTVHNRVAIELSSQALQPQMHL